ncbi:MAG TPA: HAMP domain-containing sensor histidine kinase [Myxococcota bacterium]|nr:HAMP domain-containing sensor histidine kinase [Myxococcota bacterium]
MNPLGRYVRARLHRRIFVWFGLSIAAAGGAAAIVMGLLAGEGEMGWRRETERAEHFVRGRFAHVWALPAERDALARAIADDLDVDVTLADGTGKTFVRFGKDPCDAPFRTVAVTATDAGAASAGAAPLGYVSFCWGRHRPFAPWRALLPLLLVGAVLWAASGKIARRVARPLAELTRVATDIGAGRLQSRARLGRHEPGEVGLLADAVNEMAARIEQQLADQRELLAAVSHEIRTPLARMRLLVELLRSSGADAARLEDLDREVVEIDALVGELLASARLDFATFEARPLDPVEAARRALERAGADVARLVVEGAPGRVEGDATLVARALANVIDNARRHGEGLVALRVRAREGFVAFVAEDGGAGFAPGDEARAFEAFFQRPGAAPPEHSGLGLGLSLVRRIAEVHGGRAFAQNRAGGGAAVGFELPVSASGSLSTSGSTSASASASASGSGSA